MNAVSEVIGVQAHASGQTTPAAVPAGSVALSASKIAGSLALVALALIVLAIVGQTARWEYGSTGALVSAFDLDAEKNVPALFSGFIIALAGAIVWLCHAHETHASIRRKWKTLSLGILLMGIDEVFSIHERPMDAIRAMLGGGDLGMLTFAWVLPALLLLPLIFYYFVGLLRALPRATARGFVLAGALYLGGAVAMEMVGGKYFASYGSNLIQSMIAIAEESCEMLGICFFIYVALAHLARYNNDTTLRHID